MQSLDGILVWLILGCIVAAVFGFYAVMLRLRFRQFRAAMSALRDRIDGSRRW